MTRYFLGVAAFLLAPMISAAVYSNVVMDKSSISFQSKQMGVPVKGRIAKFTSKLNYNSTNIGQSTLQITVDIATIDAGSDEATQEVKGKDWLNVAKYPTAIFTSNSVEAAGAGKVKVKGMMTMKGKSLPIEMVAQVTEKDGTATFDGQVELKRTQFAIGEGEWADVKIVADELQIQFHIVAKSDGK